MKMYIAETEKSVKNIVVDDMILTTDMPTSAGSRMLDGYMSLFEAEAVTKLTEAGYKVYAKANTGEFGLDLMGETSFYGPVEADGVLTTAAAQAVKSGDAMAAVTLEVNGASARGAALAGLTFVKPTYGTVSRYGVISCAASGEQLGVYAKDASGVAEIMSVIAGHDDKDGTSLPEKSYNYETLDAKGKKVCIVKELLEKADAESSPLLHLLLLLR